MTGYMFKRIGSAGSDLLLALTAGSVCTVLHLISLDVISFAVVKERLVKLILIFEGLAESKLQVDSILPCQVRVFIQLQHSVNLVIIEPVSLQIS